MNDPIQLDKKIIESLKERLNSIYGLGNVIARTTEVQELDGGGVLFSFKRVDDATPSELTYLVMSPMYEMISSLGCCGCGDPAKTYKAIHEMLLYYGNYDTRSDHKPWPERFVTDNPYVQFMVYILDNEGFLAHGSNIDGAWLTDKGKELLRYLTEFAKYDYEVDDAPQELMYVLPMFNIKQRRTANEMLLSL